MDNESQSSKPPALNAQDPDVIHLFTRKPHVSGHQESLGQGMFPHSCSIESTAHPTENRTESLSIEANDYLPHGSIRYFYVDSVQVSHLILSGDPVVKTLNGIFAWLDQRSRKPIPGVKIYLRDSAVTDSLHIKSVSINWKKPEVRKKSLEQLKAFMEQDAIEERSDEGFDVIVEPLKKRSLAETIDAAAGAL